MVFTPGNEGYWQTKGTLLKWKWFEDNTVDFFVDADAVYDALAQAGANRVARSVDSHTCIAWSPHVARYLCRCSRA